MSATAFEIEAREVVGERVVALDEPMPHQQDVILDPARFKVLLCGRRWGKTAVGRVMALIGHGPTCSERKGALYGGYVWWVMPSMPTARDTWDAFEHALRDVWVRRNVTERFFDLPGGGRLQVKSADEPERLRGSGLDLVVLDELKDQPVEVWKAIRPALMDKRGSLLAMGTPGDVGDLSHQLHEKALSRPGWRLWQRPTSDNPIVTPDELEDLLEELGDNGYAREVEARFVSDKGGRIKPEWFRFYDIDGRDFVIDGERIPMSSVGRFLSADLAVSKKDWADYTAAPSWGRLRDRRLLMLDLFHDRVDGGDLVGFNEEGEVVGVLPELMASTRSSLLLVQAGGPLAAINSQARKAGLPVREVNFENKDKVTCAEPVASAVRGGQLLLPRPSRHHKQIDNVPWPQKVINQLCAFPDPGVHDDIVDACSLAVAAYPPFVRPDQKKPGERRRVAREPRKGEEGEGWLIGR